MSAVLALPNMIQSLGFCVLSSDGIFGKEISIVNKTVTSQAYRQQLSSTKEADPVLANTFYSSPSLHSVLAHMANRLASSSHSHRNGCGLEFELELG